MKKSGQKSTLDKFKQFEREQKTVVGGTHVFPPTEIMQLDSRSTPAERGVSTDIFESNN